MIDGASNIFELNSRIYYTKFNSNDLHDFPISLKDFEKTRFPLFLPIENTKQLFYIVLGTLLIVIFFSFSIFYRNRKKNIKSSNSDKIDSSELIEDAMEFNAIEMSLVNQIISKKNKHELFSVTDFNNSLGLNKKTL